MLEAMPAPTVRPCGFHAAANVAGLNQNQPMMDNNPTGMMTPHTVMEPIRPVILGPPTFATEEIERQRSQAFRLVHFTVADEGPYTLPAGIFQAAIP